jgi:serine/threonine protein kinase
MTWAISNSAHVFPDFVTGELFGLLVKDRGVGEDKARFFFRQLVEGVKCCHEQGICHRDLKVSVHAKMNAKSLTSPTLLSK